MSRVKICGLTREEDVDAAAGVEAARGVNDHSNLRAFMAKANQPEGREVAP